MSCLERRCFNWFYHRLLVAGKRWLKKEDYVDNKGAWFLTVCNLEQITRDPVRSIQHSRQLKLREGCGECAHIFPDSSQVIRVIQLIWNMVAGFNPFLASLEAEIEVKIFCSSAEGSRHQHTGACIRRWIFNFSVYVNGK